MLGNGSRGINGDGLSKISTRYLKLAVCSKTVEAMCNLLAILTPTAMRLLWLRQTAQVAPDTPATEVISKEVIQVVLHLDKRPKATLTARDSWRTLARFAGYLHRKSQPR